MNIKIIFLIVAVLTIISQQSVAQEYEKTEIEIHDNISRANISLQGVYYSFEKKLAPFISLYSDIGLGGQFGYSSTIGARWEISPIIATEGRWYFNYRKRYNIGKKLLFNSADFLCLQAAYVFKPIEQKSYIYYDSGGFLSINIGMQRTWGKHINFEFKVGYGMGYSNLYNSFGHGGNINLKFGYIFNRAK